MSAQGWSRLVLSVLLAGLMVGGASAAEAPPKRISLAQAIAIALRSNRTLLAASYAQDAAQATVGVARGAMLPRLDAIENYSATDNPVLVFSDLLLQQDFSQSDFALSSLNHPGTLSNFQSQIQLSFPVYAGGRLLASFKAAKFGAEAATWRQARTREQIAFATIKAYFTAVLAEERVGVIERARAAADAHLTQSRNLFAEGMAANADILRTEVLTGGLEEEDTDARSQMQIAWAALAHVLGDENERLAPLPMAQSALGVGPTGSLDLAELNRQAIASRPEMGIAAANVGQAEQAVTIARADYLPSVGVATTYENDSEELVRAGNNYAVFVYARLNLFNGLATKNKVDEALAQLNRAKTLAEDLKHAIGLEVERAYRTLAAAQQNVSVAQRNYSYASAALKILEDRYGAGLATNVAVLDAQTTRQRADMERIRAHIALAVDRAALELVVGRMPMANGQ
ncbi:MAG TPA: TolC family protein [Candidatus Binataceae bacterium]|nr:TolC family protein [Candidatus Binataceae bacterium]